MKLPSVLIFTPIYEAKDYCLDEFWEKASKINYPNKRHIIIDNSATTYYYDQLCERFKDEDVEIYHVERGNNTREALARAQNFARKIAINEDYAYMLSLESDIMVPPEIVQRLLVHGLDCVTALYFLGDRSKGIRIPCITLQEFNSEIGAWGTRLLKPEEYFDYLNKGLKRVQAGGMGCCLMHKNTWKDVGFTYDPRFGGHSDVYFFNRMFMKHIPVLVDTDIVLDHQNSDWNKVEDR